MDAYDALRDAVSESRYEDEHGEPTTDEVKDASYSAYATEHYYGIEEDQ